jgi:DNA replication protein DnaC
MDDLIVKLKKDQEAGRTGKRRSYYKSSLVIVDEVGYTPLTVKNVICSFGSSPSGTKKQVQ